MKRVMIAGCLAIILVMGLGFVIFGQSESNITGNVISLGETCESLTDLELYLPLDGSGRDRKGDNNAVIAGAKTVPGKIGLAYLFNGSNQRIFTEDNVDISGNQARTLAFWAKADSAVGTSHNSGIQFVAGMGESDVASRFAALTRWSNWTFWFWGIPGADIHTEVPVKTGEWQFHTLTYDGEKAKWYLDGILIGERTVALNTPAKPLQLGRGTNQGVNNEPDPAYEFLGSIDEVSLWNRALTEEEIDILYNSGSGTLVCLPPLECSPGESRNCINPTVSKREIEPSNFVLLGYAQPRSEHPDQSGGVAYTDGPIAAALDPSDGRYGQILVTDHAYYDDVAWIEALPETLSQDIDNPTILEYTSSFFDPSNGTRRATIGGPGQKYDKGMLYENGTYYRTTQRFYNVGPDQWAGFLINESGTFDARPSGGSWGTAIVHGPLVKFDERWSEAVGGNLGTAYSGGEFRGGASAGPGLFVANMEWGEVPEQDSSINFTKIIFHRWYESRNQYWNGASAITGMFVAGDYLFYTGVRGVTDETYYDIAGWEYPNGTIERMRLGQIIHAPAGSLNIGGPDPPRSNDFTFTADRDWTARSAQIRRPDGTWVPGGTVIPKGTVLGLDYHFNDPNQLYSQADPAPGTPAGNISGNWHKGYHAEFGVHPFIWARHIDDLRNAKDKKIVEHGSEDLAAIYLDDLVPQFRGKYAQYHSHKSYGGMKYIDDKFIISIRSFDGSGLPIFVVFKFSDHVLEEGNLSELKGVCEGSVETCTSEGQWPGCDFSGISGYEESEVSCADGLDNDCNGIFDLEEAICSEDGSGEYEDEDVNGDTNVDIADLVSVAQSFGDSGCRADQGLDPKDNYCQRRDVDKSGSVNVVDMIKVAFKMVFG